MKLTVKADGPADPDLVWDRYLRPARWPEWSPQIASVDYPQDEIAPGGRGVVHGPCGFSIDFLIQEVDRARRSWRWRVSRLGVTLTLVHVVTPGANGSAAGSGTTTTLDIDGPAPVVVGYAPIARIALRRLVR